MLKISAIVLIALGLWSILEAAAALQQTNTQESQKWKTYHKPYIILTSNIIRSVVLQIFTDCRSCGNDFNAWILYHGK
jgi:hypothetical protein